MTARLKRGAIPMGLAVASLAVAVLQRPGATSSDTKIDLHVDPVGFLADVASPWTDAFGLGAVWSGQYSGYLWPTGPFFALGHLLELPAWLVHRLWLGALLALAAWGAVRLVDALHRPERGVAHLVAGAVTVANPYVVVFANRTSVALLAYAALPWLLVATHGGLRSPRSWWWPAAFALILASAGGGVNAATIAWVLAGPALLVAYELAVLRCDWRAARGFALRAVPLAALASAWWVVPALVQAAGGIDFLIFTEQPDVIWHTTSLTESLRGLGYWVAYTEIDFGAVPVPFFSNADTLLFDPAVVVASLLVPALAVAGFLVSRRHAYGPFLLAMALLGAVMMTAGFPEGTPLRRAVTALYENAESVQFLRTTYKAGPLLAIGLALLLGLAAEAAWSRMRGVAVRVVAGAAGAALLALAAWPLSTGDAVDPVVDFDLPASWTRAADDLDRSLPHGTRAVVLPGSLFGFYRWGGTTDAALPALTDRPVAERFVVPYSDLRAIDLLWSVDGLVQERRILPGQLRPLLELMGAGAVVAPFDYDPRRAGSVPPADAMRALAEGGLDRPSRAYGRTLRRAASGSSLDPPLALPDLRRYDLGSEPGLVRVLPRAPATVVDGSAGGVIGLAAFGALRPDRPLLYAADRDPAELRRLARQGATFVISDSNRRRAFVNSRIRANTGRTLDAGAEIPSDVAVLDPFAAGADAQTTATFEGARFVRGTVEASFEQFPERAPIAAFDGNAATAWVTNAFLRQGERPFLEVGFRRPRDVPVVDLLPYGDKRGRPVEVRIAGRTHSLRSGWNRLRLDLRDVDGLRVEISRSAAPPRGGGPGGIRELRIPGFEVRQRLRVPLLAARALRGEPPERSHLTFLAERTTAFAPWRRNPPGSQLQARDLRDRADAEERIERVVEMPTARRFRVDAWVSPGPSTPAATLDRLGRTAAAATFSSSPPFESVPGRRASRAFDGDRGSGWIGALVPGRRAWLGWRMPEPRGLRSLRLIRPAQAVRFPSTVRLFFEGGATPPLPVGRDGRVTLPRRVTARRFRLEVLEATLPDGLPAAAGRRRAVGIGELRGAGVPSASLPRSGPIRGRCGDAAVIVDGRRVPLRPVGEVGDLDAGRPLRAQGCGRVTVRAGRRLLEAAAGPLRVDLLRLDSNARFPAREVGGGSVLDPGREGRGELSDVEVKLDGPSWLVLGESYNSGWRASCDGRGLGAPVPIAGYANGWPVDRCRSASFSFRPELYVELSYAVSILTALALLALLLVRRRPATRRPHALSIVAGAPRPWPLPAALLAGAAAAAALGFVFALRAGAVLGPLVAIVLWRGFGARVLTAAAALLLGVVVPLLYLIELPPDLGGYNSSYASDLIAAHWAAVLAVTCAALAIWRASSAIRASRR